MRLLKIIACIAFLGLNGCCATVDCIGSWDSFEFNYLSSSNEDLLGGVTKKYNPEDIKFFSIAHSGKEIFSDIFIQNSTSQSPTIALVHLRSNFEVAFLEIEGVVTDTINFKFNEQDSKCCSFSMIQELKLNDIVQNLANPITIIERN